MSQNLSIDNPDIAFESLSNPDRRRIILQLYKGAPLSHESVIDLIAADEAVFYHKHLPKLHDLNVIDWDRANNKIYRGEEFENILPILNCLVET